jgi:5-formyltetrahydrofolate cyclo-ligase
VTKDDARAISLASRAARSDADARAAGELVGAAPWASLVDGETASCYLSMTGEPPTAPVIERLEGLGIRVALPIMRPGRQLAWGWHGTDLLRNGYGVLEPAPDDAIELGHMAAMLIPALRAGRDGSRLGRGAGYYDRALAAVPRHADGGPLRIVIVFDDEVDDTVPHDPLDAPVDVVITPTTVLRVS